ncbi:MAG: polysaccharide biosynthesis C-terminal domain-containing protein, partial [Lachnospiraceae bacterium]|nr:polysaccharide biosynthesis C-terminal domain-containing protein [Candidatus Equihabitans merdae]
MTKGTPWKKILVFMFPVFAGLLLQQLYNIVDTIIVGNFAGEAALASVGACGVFTMAILALANGFSAGAGILIAQLYGAGKENELRRQASTSIVLMMGMGVVVTAVVFVITPFVLGVIFYTPKSLIPDAVLYMRIYALGLIFQFGYNIVAAVLRGVGDSKATLYFLLIACIVNVGLDILLVYNLRMGVMGAAIATDIAQAGSCIAGFIYMMKKYKVFRFGLKDWTFEMPLA